MTSCQQIDCCGVLQACIAAFRSDSWELVTDWTPCAIGALPCSVDSNGRHPCFGASDLQPLSSDSDTAASSVPRNAMTFAVQSSNPAGHVQMSKEQQPGFGHPNDISAGSELVSGMREAGSADESLYPDYWQNFSDCEMHVVDTQSSRTALFAPTLLNKAVKVL